VIGPLLYFAAVFADLQVKAQVAESLAKERKLEEGELAERGVGMRIERTAKGIGAATGSQNPETWGAKEPIDHQCCCFGELIEWDGVLCRVWSAGCPKHGVRTSWPEGKPASEGRHCAHGTKKARTE